MTEIVGDIWVVGQSYGAICVTTNGVVKNNGCAVMGKGIALEAVRHYPDIDKVLGDQIREHGNHVTVLSSDPSKPLIIAFPTKNHWRDPSPISLIKQSAQELVDLLARRYRPGLTVIMPRPGCGNGGQHWPTVREAIWPIFSGWPITIISQKHPV